MRRVSKLAAAALCVLASVACIAAVSATAPAPVVKTALLIIDMQNDFMPPSGSLAVTDALAALEV
jgi:hypothetical protein